MAKIEQRLQALGIVLPAPLQLPPGMVLPFPWVRVIGSRALISGHGPTNADGSMAQPLGKLGADVSVDQGYRAARLTGLGILASLKRELGDLDRIAGWARIFGMVTRPPASTGNRRSSTVSRDLIIVPVNWRFAPMSARRATATTAQ